MTATVDATVTTREAAQQVGVSTRTIRRYADRGILPAIRLTPTSPRRFDERDVERLLDRARKDAHA